LQELVLINFREDCSHIILQSPLYNQAKGAWVTAESSKGYCITASQNSYLFGIKPYKIDNITYDLKICFAVKIIGCTD
jgi:hypothetical protein